MGDHHYAAYGLRVRSQIALAGLRPAPAGRPDVTVRCGAVPSMLPGATRSHGLWQAAPGDFLLAFDNAVRFRVTGGREIVVDAAVGAGDLADALLASSVWTALLQQRGLLTLHASALRMGAGAVLFLGASGSGKSTLAAVLAARGHPLLVDDVAAVRIDAEGPVVVPGVPSLRLWEDTLGHIGQPARALRPVRKDLRKYLLPVERFCTTAQPLRAAYLLGTVNALGVEVKAARPVTAVMWLRNYTHRDKLVDAFDGRGAHFRITTNIARNVPVVHVARPAGAWTLDDLANRVECDLSERCGP